MRPAILAAALMLAVCATSPVHAGLPTHYWSHCHGGSTDDAAYGIALDPWGNIFVIGEFYGSMDLGGGALISAGQSDIFLVKYNAYGVHVWSKRLGDTGYDTGFALVVDGSGNVCVTGGFQGTVDFGGGPLASVASADVFVASYSPAGAHRWSKRFGDWNPDTGRAIALDSAGNVLLAGWFSSLADFGGGPFTGLGNNDAFLAKFDADGSYLWSRAFSTNRREEIVGIAVDSQDNIAATGVFDAALDLGGGLLLNNGGGDVFVASFDANGAHRWSQSFGDSEFQYGTNVAVDASGAVYITGNFRGQIDFGGWTLASAGDSDAFLAKFSAEGAHRWSKRFGSTGADYGSGLAVSSWGDVFISGYFNQTVDFGDGPMTSAGWHDMFFANYDDNGVHRWSQRFGSTGLDAGWALALDSNKCVNVTGVVSGVVNLGGYPLTSAGGTDILVAKFGLPVGTGIGDTPRPDALYVDAYPNPFNPSTTIRYTVPSPGRVDLGVYDPHGTCVATLFRGPRDPGEYTEAWDGRDASGRAVSSGVYFARVSHAGGVTSCKLVLVK